MTDLKDRTALVTGSTSGIGKATALALAGRGAHVLVVGRNEQRAEQVVAEIEGNGGRASFRLTTLGDLESARELVEWATEAGGGHVDILINNAGVSVFGPTDAATEAEFDETFALNVKVPFFLVAALAPAMAERGWGSIVNISTNMAHTAARGYAVYGTVKAALIERFGQFFDPNNLRFGGDVYLSRIVAAAAMVPGVESAAVTKKGVL